MTALERIKNNGAYSLDITAGLLSNFIDLPFDTIDKILWNGSQKFLIDTNSNLTALQKLLLLNSDLLNQEFIQKAICEYLQLKKDHEVMGKIRETMK